MKCWVVMGCGREPGGDMAAEMGVCAAAKFEECACWLVAGPNAALHERCTKVINGVDCFDCPFYADFHTAYSDMAVGGHDLAWV